MHPCGTAARPRSALSVQCALGPLCVCGGASHLAGVHGVLVVLDGQELVLLGVPLLNVHAVHNALSTADLAAGGGKEKAAGGRGSAAVGRNCQWGGCNTLKFTQAQDKTHATCCLTTRPGTQHQSTANMYRTITSLIHTKPAPHINRCSCSLDDNHNQNCQPPPHTTAHLMYLSSSTPLSALEAISVA